MKGTDDIDCIQLKIGETPLLVLLNQVQKEEWTHDYAHVKT
ncbi:MAG: hypothetical protein WC785_11080 [Tatlockia sp.]|jgi:hypothetical protein